MNGPHPCEGCVFSWRHSGALYCLYILHMKTKRPCPPGRACTVKMTEELRIAMGKINLDTLQQMLVAGERNVDIARYFGVSESAVTHAKKKLKKYEKEIAAMSDSDEGERNKSAIPCCAAVNKKDKPGVINEDFERTFAEPEITEESDLSVPAEDWMEDGEAQPKMLAERLLEYIAWREKEIRARRATVDRDAEILVMIGMVRILHELEDEIRLQQVLEESGL